MALRRIQFRRGTAAQWTTANPILAQGEPGYERDTGRWKIGDGTTQWSTLGYSSQNTIMESLINGNIIVNGEEIVVYLHPDNHPASMITGLAPVALSGNYSDLQGAPEVFEIGVGSIEDSLLSDEPTAVKARLANLIASLQSITTEITTARGTELDLNARLAAIEASIADIIENGIAPLVPGVPLALGSTDVGETSVTLYWTAPSGTILDYVIQYKESLDEIWTTITDGVGANTSYEVTGLLANTLYDFRVSAINNAGEGAYSVVHSVSTLASFPYVRITTTGATFAPIVELVEDSNASVSWEVEGGTTYTGLIPNINFGSAATRYVRMKVDDLGIDAMEDVVTFNVGYNNNEDAGRINLPASYNLAKQQVTAIENVNVMTNLVNFLAATNYLACPLNFTGMSALEYIECYGAAVTAVTLTGCSSLRRLCMEGDDLAALDLNPVANTLIDLRASGNRSPLTLAPLTAPMAQLYHYCAQSEIVINHPTTAQLPVIEEWWDWTSGQTGALVIRSSAIRSVTTANNLWTSVDVDSQFPVGRGGSLNASNCDIVSVNLNNCPGLLHIQLQDNNLQEDSIDAILTEVESWGTSNGTLNLGGTSNIRPSAAGQALAATLTARGWTVTLSTTEPSAGGEEVTPGATIWQDNFDRVNATGIANVGNGWHNIVGSMGADIVNNNIVLRNATSYGAIATPAGGNLPADYMVEMTIPIGPKSNFFGLVGRWYNGHGVRLFFSGDGETNMTVGDALGFGAGNIPITPAYPPNWGNNTITHTIALRMIGTTIDAVLDGQIAATFTSNINWDVEGTEVGFCGESQDRVRHLIEVTSVEALGSVAVTGVSVESSRMINNGETVQLVAVVSPVNADNNSVTWSSSDESVATVSATGLVTAIAIGSATITVTTVDGGFTDTCDITVITEGSDILWQDNFDRANATGVANIGNGWHTVLGSMNANIENNDIRIVGGAGYGVMVCPNNGSLPADYMVEVTLPVGAKGTYFGIAGRWYNGNGVRLLFHDNTTFFVGSTTGHAENNITLSTPNFPASWSNDSITHTMALRMVGTNIEVILDGQVVCTGTCSINATQVGTEVGFCGENQNRIRHLIEVRTIGA